MLAIQVTLNVFIIAGLLASSFIIGFLLRGSRVVSLRNKVAELEKEILTSHAEILQVQREKIELMQSLNIPPIPVIPLNPSKEEKSAEVNPDVSARKKLLGKPTPGIKQQSGS